MRQLSEAQQRAHLEALAILARGIAQAADDAGVREPARVRSPRRTFLLIRIP
jgi:hypothetical protein